jgi:crotonobetainyl-CoA:carnitine CoA-transferase CaiB-like acyl-CoA transferase
LAGIRVLDFSRVLAGPFCTMMLGDLGADVLKVEQPRLGDESRAWGPPWFGNGEDRLSAYFISVNRNKRSLTLNLKSDEGRDLARRLAVQADILVENFKVGGMAEFGLGEADLRLLNPGLIYCSITGFGQDGPYRDRPGYDYVIQAMSGLMSITGPADGAPHKVGVAVADVFSGLYALSAILAALHHRTRTGQGQYIDLALLDSQIAALVNVASNTLISGQESPRLGNEHPNIVPYQTFEASDGDFVLAVGNDRQFAALCSLIGQPELAEDARFATNPARLAHRPVLVELLIEVFKERTTSEWVEGLLALGIPAAPIKGVAASLRDPQIQARSLVQTIASPLGEIPLVMSPARFSVTPGVVRRPPPGLGEHSDELLREWLGLDAQAIANYRSAGTI